MSVRREIGTAVAIAALSAVAVKLLEWGVDELRTHVERRREEAGPEVADARKG